jgi:hypothetical protein
VHALQCRVAHHFLQTLIPETIAKGLQTPEQGDRLDRLEEWFGFVTLFEVVVGDPRAEVMDVVKTDISREPLQDFR